MMKVLIRYLLITAVLSGCVTAPKLSEEELALQQTSYENAVKLMKKRRYEKAIPMLQELLATQPNKAGALLNLGIAYGKTKQPELALTTLDQALDADPVNAADRANAYNHIGIIKMAANDFSAAEKAFKKATKEDGRYANAWFNLGVLYDQKMNRPQDAVRAWQQYLATSEKPDEVVRLWMKEIQLRQFKQDGIIQ